MSVLSNPRVTLKQRPPKNAPVTLDCFVYDEGKAPTPVGQNTGTLQVTKQADGTLATAPPLTTFVSGTDGDELTGTPIASILVESLCFSVDPYMRCQFNDDTGVDYVQPFTPGECISSSVVGAVRVVEASSNPALADLVKASAYDVGSLVTLPMAVKWQRWNVFVAYAKKSSDDAHTFAPASVNSAQYPQQLPPMLTEKNCSLALGLLGITGLTAYFGITRAVADRSLLFHNENVSASSGAGEKSSTKRKKPAVLVVSTAAGATGSVVCQIAKNVHGMHVVGLTSTQDKVKFLIEDLKIDAALAYRDYLDGTPEGVAKLAAAIEDSVRSIQSSVDSGSDTTPGCVDLYFDNAGGDNSDAVIKTMKPHSQIVLCGQVAVYDKDLPYPPPIPTETEEILKSREINRERYLVLRYEKDFGLAVGDLFTWCQQGLLNAKETVQQGLANAPQAFVDVMSGANTGKMLVKCDKW